MSAALLAATSLEKPFRVGAHVAAVLLSSPLNDHGILELPQGPAPLFLQI